MAAFTPLAVSCVILACGVQRAMTSGTVGSTPMGAARMAAPLLSLSGWMRARNARPSGTSWRNS